MRCSVKVNVGFTVLATLLLVACAKEPEVQQEVAHRRVAVVETRIGERAERFIVSGRVEHSREALLSFKAGGLIESIVVDEGDEFAQGELLASLDMTEITAMVVDASEQREKAERDVRRMERLYDEDAISLKTFQDAQTGFERASAKERQAEFVLNNARIHAPFDGYIAMRTVNVGELIGEGTPVFRVVENGSKRLVRVGAPGRLLPWLHVGMTAAISVETVDEPLVGTIKRVSAVAEPGTGNFLVELELSAREFLREGLVATVELTGPPRETIVLPGSALAGGDEDRGIFFIVENDTALRRELRIQRITGDSLFVDPGLGDGIPVIISGAGFLSDGEPVNIVPSVESGR